MPSQEGVFSDDVPHDPSSPIELAIVAQLFSNAVEAASGSDEDRKRAAELVVFVDPDEDADAAYARACQRRQRMGR